MKKLYILEVIYFGVISIIASLAPRLLSPFVSTKKALDYVTICSWIICVVSGCVALWFGVKGARKYFAEKQRQKRLLTGAGA